MAKERFKYYGLVVTVTGLIISITTGFFAWGSNLQQTDVRLSGRIDGVEKDVIRVEGKSDAKCKALQELIAANQTNINEKLKLIVEYVVPANARP